MAIQANVPLLGYAGPVLGADWWGRYLAGNRNWYLVTSTLLVGYLFLFFLGILANVAGFRGVNWFMGFMIQLAVIIIAGSWMHFLLAGGADIIARIFGEAKRIVMTEGSATGTVNVNQPESDHWAWFARLGRFVLHTGLNAPIAFYAIAIWPVKDAPYLAFVALVSSISIAIAAALFPKTIGQFWTRLIWLIHLAIAVGILVFFSVKAIAPEQSKRWANWVEATFFVNEADRSKDRKEAEIRKQGLNEADTCFAKLTPNSTRDELDRCEALRKNVGTLVYEDEAARAKSRAANRLYAIRIKEAAECYDKLDQKSTSSDKEACDALREAAKGVVKDSVPAPKRVPAQTAEPLPERTSTAEPARSTSQAETSWNCDTVWKEVDYAPGRQYGKVAIGVLPAGRYRISVSGKRSQPFFTGTPAVMNQICEMDPDGRIGVCTDPQDEKKVIRNNNGDPWFSEPKPFGQTDVLIPSSRELRVPYGMFVLHAMGGKLPIGSEGTIHLSETPVALDVNNFQSPLNYGGQGSFKVQIKQCTAT